MFGKTDDKTDCPFEPKTYEKRSKAIDKLRFLC